MEITQPVQYLIFFTVPQRKSYNVEHTTEFHSTGWPMGYAAAATKCEQVLANVGKQEVQIAIMDIDVNNRAATGCDVQDDYIQIKGAFTIICFRDWKGKTRKSTLKQPVPPSFK